MDNSESILFKDGENVLSEEELIRLTFKRKIRLNDAVKLLKEAVEFINIVPNTKYGYNKNSYKLASEIDKFLKDE